jgi:hypothetical protein
LIARRMPPAPWLYAVIASGQLLVTSKLCRISNAAASLERYGSSRSSMTLSIRM